jgi:hypothetical protein
MMVDYGGYVRIDRDERMLIRETTTPKAHGYTEI